MRGVSFAEFDNQAAGTICLHPSINDEEAVNAVCEIEVIYIYLFQVPRKWHYFLLYRNTSFHFML